jgi:hypothetical protein
MSDRERREFEAAEILMAAVVGDATEAELSRLNDSIKADPDIANLVVDLMSQESWLSWQGGQAVAVPPITAAPRTALEHRTQSYFAIAAALLIAIGAAAGAIAMRWSIRAADSDPLLAVDRGSPTESSRYVARFVKGTACLWNADGASPFELDGALRKGESLNLLEGLAEVQFDWSGGAANIKLEGPAGLVLTAQRGVNLSRGRLTADVEMNDGAFMVETPNGQVEVTKDASIGISSKGEEVQLHVFRGEATFITTWSSSDETDNRLAVSSGQSLIIANEADGRTRLDHGTAHADDFASKISMRSDSLPVTREYVNEVLSGKPLLYWRFEGKEGSTVRNEVGDKYAGRVVGAVKWADQDGNKDVELGGGRTAESLHAYIISDEPLVGDFHQGYSIEMWVKPSHYHWGTVASLIGSPKGDHTSDHGMLLELGGPSASVTSIEHPGKIRFLHRSPPSGDLAKGMSCFSEMPYELRKWQHMAAVKEGSKMRLFVDGRLVASGKDDTELAQGLRLILGQLDEVRTERRFVGQIDELAIYPRALSTEEIRRRYDLIRNQPATSSRPRPAI